MKTYKQLNGGPVNGFFSDAGSIVGNFVPGASAGGNILDSIFGGGSKPSLPSTEYNGESLENRVVNVGGDTKYYLVKGGYKQLLPESQAGNYGAVIHVTSSFLNNLPTGTPPPQSYAPSYTPTQSYLPAPQQAQAPGNQGQTQMTNSVGVSKGLKYGLLAAGGLALAAVGYMVLKPKKKKSLGALTPGLPKKKAAKQRAAVFAKLDSEGKAFPKNKIGVRAKPRKAAKRKATGKKKVRRVKL